MWTFLRTLKDNPIYQRAHGRWGGPNQAYSYLSKAYLPITFSTLVLGGGSSCVAFAIWSSWGGLNPGLDLIVWLSCVPNGLMQILLWYALVLIPALIAPSVAEEVKHHTWEILRLAPQPTHHIMFAKMFGSLSDLSLGTGLVGVFLLQALAVLAGVSAVSAGRYSAEKAVHATVMVFVILLRPFLEIVYAAVVILAKLLL